MRFWDSSALTALVLDDPHTKSAEAWYRDDRDLCAWCLSPTEVWSAVARQRREGLLGSPDVRQARERLAKLTAHWYEVDNVTLVRQRSLRVLEVHPLRAADALQLAAALLATNDRPEDMQFLTFDSRLGTAADAEGFRVIGTELE